MTLTLARNIKADDDRYKKQATELGKSSFALAWVMDTGTEERERGVTVDIAQHHFSTDKVEFTILDAPGHRDFVPNMLGGASMADFAVLVVDINNLESGMKGQTKEHILLAKAVGLQRIVVAVNKLDTTVPPWSQARFDSVKNEVTGSLEKEGFDIGNIIFVPCSGLSGGNVVKPLSGEPTQQWTFNTYTTLLHALEQAIPDATKQEKVEKPFRMQITDVFRGGITNPLSIAGRIASGQIQVGDAVIVQPSGESAAIKAIEVNAEGRDWAVAGELCNLHLTDVDAQYLHSGDTVCDSRKPVLVAHTVTVDITALDSLLPQSVDIHIGRLNVPGAVSQLLSTLDAKGEVLKKKPRIIKTGQRAAVKITLETPAPLEAGDCVVLRAEGSTIAAGTVDNVNS
jgi:elongation factor 1 alpha-like protein